MIAIDVSWRPRRARVLPKVGARAPPCPIAPAPLSLSHLVEEERPPLQMIWRSAVDNTASGPITYQSDFCALIVLRKYDL